MKKIIFLTYGISGCGGGQIYISNQIDFYDSLGYTSYIYYHLTGEIILSRFKSFGRACYIPELKYPVNYFTESKWLSIVEKIKKSINYNKDDEILIESNSINHAMWGELLASKLNAKHFFYILGENDIIPTEDIYRFLRFKLSRKEIAGIVSKSIPNMFVKFETINEDESYSLLASARTWWEDYDVEAIDSLPKSDYTVGLFSRLEKPFVLPSLTELSQFIKKNNALSFNVIIVGDSDNKKIATDIRMLFDGISNVNLVMTGVLSPPPMRYVKKCDLCLGSSGCAKLSNSFGRLTISFDGNDGQPIGILNYTTDNSLYRDTEEMIPLETLLEDIFIYRKYPFSYNVPKVTIDNRHYSELHHRFIEESCSNKVYYDMGLIRSSIFDKKNGTMVVIKNFIRGLIGMKLYKQLHDLLN